MTYDKELERQKIKSLIEAGGYADDQKAASPRICPRRLLYWVSTVVIVGLVGIAAALTIG